MGLRNKIVTKKTIALFLTAEDWDLYTTKEGADVCADRLNSMLEDCVNARMGLDRTLRYMLDFMESEREFGAADSEPLRVLDELLNMIYGDTDV